MSVESRYFNWLTKMVTPEGINYGPLLDVLHHIQYQWRNPMDSNRASDGMDLRYRYCYETCEDESQLLPGEPCSVLEMMAALALRCEEDVMSNPLYGDRTPEWFWGMLGSMGICQSDWEHLDPIYIHRIIDRMMDGGYERNGRGGLFTVGNPFVDMRSIEIWEQMMHCMNEKVQYESVIPE